jgi:D-alanyl-D-alanine carboxypeptidase
MPGETSTKEKILAIFSVFFLFLIVGALLWFISYNNKNKTEILNNRVLQQEIERENIKRLQNLRLDTVSSTTAPAITGKSFLTLAVTDGGTKKILNQKNPDQALPIASITKLMVAVIVLENIDLQKNITATLDYIGQEESAFILETDKIYKVKELLANALVSSDNDSARLLAGILGEQNFVTKMNQKARALGLSKTFFVNSTGLDPKDLSSGINVSSVTDLANLLIYIKSKHPEILRISSRPQYNICDINNYCKMVLSTYKLLENKDFRFRII